MSVEDVTEILPIDLIGAIPDDEQVVIGTNQGEAVVDMDSLAGKAYTNICRRITGEEVPFLDLDKQESFTNFPICLKEIRRMYHACI
mgnify:CR=1 FL=1